MIDIHQVNSGDPFKNYPWLQNIWPQPYLEQAKIASSIDSDTGEIFFITYEDIICGLTGYFIDEESDPEHIFLRWTGVVPGMRKQGVTREAIRLLCETLSLIHPDRTTLIELVPNNEYGNIVVRPFFERIGFQPIDINIPVGEDTDWPVLAYGGKINKLKEMK